MLMMQHSYKAGVWAFGERVENTKLKEPRQLDSKEAVVLKLASKLTEQQMREALESIMTIKEKQNEKLIRCNCAGARK